MIKLLKDVLNLNGEDRIKILASLINSNSYEFKEIDYIKSENEENYFLFLLFKDLINVSVETQLDFLNILDNISQFKEDEFKLDKFINENVKLINSFIKTSSDDFCLKIFNYINYNNLDKDFQKNIIILLSKYNRINTLSNLIEKNDLDLNNFYIYTITKNESYKKVNKIPLILLFNISDNEKYKNFNERLGKKINFDSIMESHYYSNDKNFKLSREDNIEFVNNLDDNNVSLQEELKNEFEKEDFIKVEYNTILSAISNKYSKDYRKLSEKVYIGKYDKEELKVISLKYKNFIEILNVNNLWGDFLINNVEKKEALNNSLIVMVNCFPETFKNLLKSNPKVVSLLDLNYKNIKNETIGEKLLNNYNYKLFNKILKLKKQTINDIYINNDVNIFAGLKSSMLNSRKKIKKTELSSLNEFLNKVKNEININYKNDDGNLIAQFLNDKKTIYFNVDYLRSKDKSFKIDRTYYADDERVVKNILNFFIDNGIKLEEKNKYGIMAQDYLFINYLNTRNDAIKKLFLEGSEEYKIKKFADYTLEEKKLFIKNIGRLFQKNELFDNLNTLNFNQMLSDFNKMEILNNPELRKELLNGFKDDIKMDKVFKNSSNYNELNSFKILIEKEKLLETLVKENNVTDVLEKKKVNKI